MAIEELFEITDDIRDIASLGFGGMIRQLGRDFEVHYPPTWVTDATVVSDAIGNKPASRWITGEAGTPDPTIDTIGMRAVDTFDIVRMLVAWGRKDFFIKPDWNVLVPTGAIQTKSFIEDASKIMKAEYILLNDGRFNMKYKRDGEPIDVSNITPNTFVVTSWKRVQ